MKLKAYSNVMRNMNKEGEENLANAAAQLANYPLTFETANQLIESYLMLQEYSTFTQIKNII